MNRKLIIALAAMALAAFGIAACGGDDDDGDGETTAQTTTTDDATTTAGDGDGGASGPGGTIEPVADPGGAFAYETGSLSVKSGEVTIEFANPSSVQHDVNVENADGETLGGTDVITDSSTTATVELPSGDYVYYCSVDGHRAAGMEDTLTVK